MNSIADHTMLAFDADLRALRSRVESMGHLVGQQVAEAAEALINHDLAAAKAVICRHQIVCASEQAIEQASIETIARRQPFAIDLREIICAFRIANDLVRIGDLARGIAIRATSVGPLPVKLLSRFRQLSSLVCDRVHSIVQSYAERDELKARLVWQSDREVDDAHGLLFRGLLTHMLDDPRNIPTCTFLLFCAKNMERIGDHATNIAEAIQYMVTGELFDGDRPKGEAAETWDAGPPHSAM